MLVSGCTRTHTVQKQINVIEQFSRIARTRYYEDNYRSISAVCSRYSIDKENIDEILEKGGKIVTTKRWSKNVRVDQPIAFLKLFDSKQNGTCYGTTYVIEGSEKLLDKYKIHSNFRLP